VSLGPWFKARRNGVCSECRAEIKKNDQMRMAGYGHALCENCGEAAQSAGVGPNELGVLNDLEKFPDEAKQGAIAQNMLFLASQLDSGIVSPRDVGTLTKEIRQGLVTLITMYPPEPEKDGTDTFTDRRRDYLNKLRE
jgi:hypothetical protein